MERAFPCRSAPFRARRGSVPLACIAAALMFGVAALAAASMPLVVLSQTFATGAEPRWVALEDLNGDGRPDLVTANQERRTISVLTNSGDGFSRRRDYRTGGLPRSGAIGDLDGDGAPDVAVANLGPDKVSVLLNIGDGRFRAPVDYGAGLVDYPSSVAIGDLDGDGKADLVIANGGSSTVSVLMNRGDGSFETARDYAAGFEPVAAAIADVNGDGGPDVVSADFGNFSVLLNNGDGTLRRGVEHRTEEHSVSLAVADLDGDSRPDLAIANGRVVGVFLNRSHGSAWSTRNYRVPSPGEAVAIGDLNGDSRPELVVATAHIPGTISVLSNTGDGRFRDRRDYGRGNYLVAVAIGDVNNDGKLDVAAANFGSSTVSVFRNRTGERIQICTVPNVRGLQLAAAKRKLVRAHCRAGRISHQPYQAPEGRVMWEAPPAGTRMRSGGRVDLVVSQKPRP
jgi:FG-GAP-like repeat/PASTA domain